MSSELKKEYKKEYNNVKFVVKSTVSQGKEREELLSDLYALYYSAQKNKTDIRDIYDVDRDMFVKEILEDMPVRKHYKANAVVSGIFTLIMGILTILFAYALMMNVRNAVTDRNIIGGATTTTDIMVNSNGMIISLVGFIIFVVLTIVGICRWSKKRKFVM